MKTNNIILLIVLAFAVIACEPSKEVNNKKVAESLSSEKARKYWEEVGTKETVSALNDLISTTKTLVSQRKKEVSSKEDSRPQAQTPVFNKNQIAGVEVRSSTDISTYQGIFEVQNIDSNLLRGKIEGDVDFNIYYKLPKNNLTNFIKAKLQLTLFYETKIVSGSNNQVILLMEKKNPLLISIEEGSNEPFQKEYAFSNLSVKQIISEKRESSTVEVTFYDQKFIITPGQNVVRKVPNGEVEFFLKTSYAKPKSVMEEGLNYYVRLYAYVL